MVVKKRAKRNKSISTNQGRQPSSTVTIELDRYIPEDLISHYADGLTVMHTENEFVLSFFQSQYGVSITEEEFAKAGKVKSKCVTRVIISPKHMLSFVQVLADNYRRYANNYLGTDIPPPPAKPKEEQ
jgi:hypothetical protein